MNKINYQRVMEEEIEKIKAAGTTPSLLLHSCCGPCSSYVLECVARFFSVTLFYYNPNIYPEKEYIHRLNEQIKLINAMPSKNKISLMESEYDHGSFLTAVKGLEKEKEGGKRCTECFKLRLTESAKKAKEYGFDYFSTTLTVSPHKNSQLLNELGKEISNRYSVKYLYSDFKKKEGYKRSVQLAKQYELYRQNYCGCEFSVWWEDEK